MKSWHFVVEGVVIFIALSISIWYTLRPDPIIQPMNFNHKIHLETKSPDGQAKITCKNCHKYYETRTVAGRPSIDTCLTCHTTSKDKPEVQKILDIYERGEEIAWKRIYSIPSHVFFSHQRHVLPPRNPAQGKAVEKAEESLLREIGTGEKGRVPIACEVCHGPIGKTETPPSAPLNDITMDFCIDCHKREVVSVDCIACHR